MSLNEGCYDYFVPDSAISDNGITILKPIIASLVESNDFFGHLDQPPSPRIDSARSFRGLLLSRDFYPAMLNRSGNGQCSMSTSGRNCRMTRSQIQSDLFYN
jgi:hypothetical protein